MEDINNNLRPQQALSSPPPPWLRLPPRSPPAPSSPPPSVLTCCCGIGPAPPLAWSCFSSSGCGHISYICDLKHVSRILGQKLSDCRIIVKHSPQEICAHIAVIFNPGEKTFFLVQNLIHNSGILLTLRGELFGQLLEFVNFCDVRNTLVSDDPSICWGGWGRWKNFAISFWRPVHVLLFIFYLDFILILSWFIQFLSDNIWIK